MAHRSNIRIVTRPDDLDEGLFGQIFLFVFEALPYLDRHGFLPEWDIRAARYGAPPMRRIIPGVLDIAYVPQPATRDVPLEMVRNRHCARLGGDWQALHDLWTRYFRVPARIEAEADAVGPLSDVLGIHYRGTDKVTASWDSNFVSHEDYATIIADFRHRRPDLRRLFVASDDNGFAPFLARRFPDAELINLGEVGFHKAEVETGDLDRKADRALLDCVLLSRCGAVLKTSSALSGFTKILRPDLEIYRCAASKLFADVPYFPVAYIPRYQSDDPHVRTVLDRLMADDWTMRASDGLDLAHRPRWRKQAFKWGLLEAMFGRLKPLPLRR